MDIERHEKACALQAKIKSVKQEISLWRLGHVCLAKRRTYEPERLNIDLFTSMVAGAFYPAFAAQCIDELERRLAAAEQEFAEL